MTPGVSVVTAFSGRSSKGWPKLYVAVAEGQPVYVGVTRRRMSARLRMGWTAKGKGGYYGYAWRHKLEKATLFIWHADTDGRESTQRELETIEAEVVYAIRSRGQWPEFQTEIHFYQSSESHRIQARRVLGAIDKAVTPNDMNRGQAGVL